MVQCCKGCGLEKPLADFYLSRGKPRKTCKSCCAGSWDKTNSGKRTPQQKAEYRRRIGETLVPYQPKVERMAQAAEKRAIGEAANHASHVALWRRESRRLHNAHVIAFKDSGALFRIKYNTDPAFATKQRLRTQLRKKRKLHPKLDDLMREAINRGGQSKAVESVCGYSIAQLIAHMESQFQSGMSWDAFLTGDIHIDHIRPQCTFDLTTIEGVRACWALTNLQPLWARDNIVKGARLDWTPMHSGSSGGFGASRTLRTAMFP